MKHIYSTSIIYDRHLQSSKYFYSTGHRLNSLGGADSTEVTWPLHYKNVWGSFCHGAEKEKIVNCKIWSIFWYVCFQQLALKWSKMLMLHLSHRDIILLCSRIHFKWISLCYCAPLGAKIILSRSHFVRRLLPL